MAHTQQTIAQFHFSCVGFLKQGTEWICNQNNLILESALQVYPDHWQTHQHHEPPLIFLFCNLLIPCSPPLLPKISDDEEIRGTDMMSYVGGLFKSDLFLRLF